MQSNIMFRVWRIAVLMLLVCQLHAADWEILKDCRLIDNPSNDGDSFRVRASNGDELLFRLYHVDCPESESDSLVAERITKQAVHFGITESQSLRGGVTAKDFTKKALSQPFVIVTRFQKAMGRSKLQRYYAVVLVGGKTDLAEMLVRAGLARAFGQVVDAPKGKRMAGYVELEKTVKAGKVGLYGGNAPTAAESGGGLLDINTASKEELIGLPGVGTVIAERIIQSRPYSSIDDLEKVKGLGVKKISTIAPLVSF